MGWSADVVTEYLEPEVCLPAVGQGALSIECRADDYEPLEQLAKLNSQETTVTVTAERAFLHKMEGGRQVPVAGFAKLSDQQISLTGLVASPDGKTIYKETATGKDPIKLGEQVAEMLIDQGAKLLIDQVKQELDQS